MSANPMTPGGAPLSPDLYGSAASVLTADTIPARGKADPGAELCARLTGHLQNGRFEAAFQESDVALKERPRSIVLWVIKGYAAFALGDAEIAAACASRALKLDRDAEAAIVLRAECLRAREGTEPATRYLERAFRRIQTSERGILLLANWQHTNGAFSDAVETIHRALENGQGGSEMLALYGRALMELQQTASAEKALSIAIKLNPANANAHLSRGFVLTWKRDPEAVDSFERALALSPNEHAARLMLLYTALGNCDWDRFDSYRGNSMELARLGTEAATPGPWAALAFADDPGAARARGRHKTASFASRSGITRSHRMPQPLPHSQEKIRVGYFSSDFCNHATVQLLRGLIDAHDRNGFEIHCFDFGRNDAVGAQFRTRFDAVHDLRLDDDRTAVARARDARIDIAIDLKGHTRNARTALFLHGLAPVQVNYLGYPGSIGGDAHDYIIADPVVLPEELEHYYDERVVRLPTCYLPVDPARIAGPPPPRAQLGLPEDAIVLACLNATYKISRASYGAWMEGLRANPKAVLWLMGGNEVATDNLRAAAVAHGIDPERLVFAPSVSGENHIARLRQADLFVDTFHVNAHTLAADALVSAGLPMLTRAGRQFAARVGASFLTAAGLPELITDSTEAYTAKLVELVRNPDCLRDLRAKLAANRATAPLFDNNLYARAFEEALTRMHEDACAAPVQTRRTGAVA